MPRVKRATPRELPESRFLASRIQDAKRRGATNAEIAREFGINERTVRKIRSGETSGARIYARKIEKAPENANPSIVRVDVMLGYDRNGDRIIRTVNAKVPVLTSASGKRVTPTPFDVFRLPNLQEVAEAERKRMLRQYGIVVARPPKDTDSAISTIRPIVHRNPATTLHTITGRVA